MITKLEHAALSVHDMERSLAFYRDVLGMEVQRFLEPGFGGDKLGVVVGLPHCSARIAHLVMGGFMLELFEYQDPSGNPIPRDATQANHGFSHIGFTSTDVREDYERMRGLGVSFISAPVEFRPGVWIVYFYGPDGEVCELRQAPRPS
jgi:catechol 2,3-dioxygenase-like lactoylglutathione lyase family enzyme